jgi:hypothetical protein
VFFDEPSPRSIAPAIERLVQDPPDPDELRAQAESFSEASFIRRLNELLAL